MESPADAIEGVKEIIFGGPFGFTWYLNTEIIGFDTLPTARSYSPFPSRSERERLTGPGTTSISTRDANERIAPPEVFLYNVMELSGISFWLSLATAISGLPSPSRSPITIDLGLDPQGYIAGLANARDP